MDHQWTYFAPEQLSDMSDIPADSILSRTILDTDALRLVLFQFAAGQHLSEHTASMPAVIQIISGEALLTLGDQPQQAGPGAMVYMEARLTHAVEAQTPLVMLLHLVKSGG